LRAVLRYTDCLQDGKNVFRVLSESNVDMLDIKQWPWSICPEITILIDNRRELNELLDKLNRRCTYEVRLVKTKKERVCDSCKQRDCHASIRNSK